MSADTVLFAAAAGLFASVICFGLFGLPLFVTRWFCRWDGDAAYAKAMEPWMANIEASRRELSELIAANELVQAAFDKAMADVERHIALHKRLDERKDRVARRRPLQRKLGRIA